MPLPLPSFTRSKWLAFFAELVAKINHHNPRIVIEGCDYVRRLLTTRLSVGAFLEEGSFLHILLDVMQGVSRIETPPTAVDTEMFDALARTLWLMIDMMSSLAVDGDVYYTLLVVARSVGILKCTLALLQNNTRLYFGRTAYYTMVLLSLPLSSVLSSSNAALDAATASQNVALQMHIRQLQESVLQLPALMVEYSESMSALVSATSDVSVACAAAVLRSLAVQQHKRFQRHLTGAADVSRDEEEISILRPHEPTASDVRSTVVAFGSCRSHQEFFETLNRLWCFTVGCRRLVAETIDAPTFQHVERFLTKAPQNHLDLVLFASLLSWIVVIGSVESLNRGLLERLAAMVPSYFIPFLEGAQPAAPLVRGDHQTSVHTSSHVSSSVLPSWMNGEQQQQHHASSSILASTSIPNNVNYSNPLVTSFRTNNSNINQSSLSVDQRGGGASLSTSSAATTASRPSITIHIASFLIFLERTLSVDSAAAWIRSGIVRFLEACVRQAQGVTSVLIEAPTTADGSLSDEAYLRCAMNSARVETSTIAVVGCKLLASLLSNFSELFLSEFQQETVTAVDILVPQLLGMVLRNPTLSSAEENKPGSILHHVNHCHRAARSTSLGECAAGALDACLMILNPAEMDSEKLREMVLLLSALTRATRYSVIPHLRALPYRMLSRICSAPSHLVLAVREMPSIISSAVKCVQEVNAREPQWECAAAAEWLTRVILVASADVNVERMFDLGQTALPVTLLQLAASTPVGYTSAAMISLAAALFYQQKRLLEGRGGGSGGVAGGALLPMGRKSLALWNSIMHSSAQANRSLKRAQSCMTPTRSSTRDVFSRALAVYEDLAAQFAYTASTALNLSYVVESDAHCREGLGDGLLYEFVDAALQTPTPFVIQHMVSVRYGVDCPITAILRRGYDAMVQNVCHLFATWVSPMALYPLEGVPPSLLSVMAELMADDTVPSGTRCHLAKIVNSSHSVPNQTTLRRSFSEFAGALFDASLSLTSEAPIVSAMRCRLLAEHVGASRVAATGAWLCDSLIQPLQKLQVILTRRGELSSVQEMDAFHLLMSYFSSFLANSECAAISSEATEAFASAWLTFLRAESTRSVAIRSLPFVVRSAAGRLVALCEPSKSGDPSQRSCIAFIARQVLTSNDSGARSGKVNGTKSLSTKDISAAFEGLTSAATLDRDPNARVLMKLRAVDAIESVLVHCDQQHTIAPISYVRLLAALSFASDMQVWIAQRGELITAIIAIANEWPTTEHGVLSLLTLRNLCFHPSLKIQMCQDGRLLLTMRHALLCQSTSTNPRYLGDPSQAPLVPLEPSTEVLQRQETAARCFWALSFNNERGRAYVRGALQKCSGSSKGMPSSPSLQLLPAASAPSSSSSSVSGSLKPLSTNTNLTTLSIPQVEYSDRGLQSFGDLISESLQALTQLEVVKTMTTTPQ